MVYDRLLTGTIKLPVQKYASRDTGSNQLFELYDSLLTDKD